jgi:hypothetical protein
LQIDPKQVFMSWSPVFFRVHSLDAISLLGVAFGPTR